MRNTKLVMASSAIVMGFVGLCCTFLPDEIQQMAGAENIGLFPITIQLLGAIYFAFGALNWTAKANLIGGIYSRPVAMGNLVHFVMASLALFKFFMAHSEFKILLIPIAICAIFAICFWKVVFTSPV